ncbi:MAG: hypothetical protein ABIK44_04500, partial [candidate division WOR-3 bacterium]
MKRLTVDDELVRNLTGELGPLVEELTRWPVTLETLSCRVLPKDRGYEEIILGRLCGAGIAVDEAESRTILDRLLEFIIEGVVLAAYQPATEELLVIRENVDESNLDGLRLVIGHELVHRAQHLRHPKLFRRVAAVIVEVFHGAQTGALSLRAALAKVAGLKPVMTVIESHAWFIQDELHRRFFPNAVIE